MNNSFIIFPRTQFSYTLPASSNMSLSLLANPVINRLCKNPPATINGTKARTSNVNCHEKTKLTIMPVPSEAKF